MVRMRFLALFVCALFVLSFSSSAMAADTSIVPESTFSRLPAISVFFYPRADDGSPSQSFQPDTQNFSASLAGEPLAVHSVGPYTGANIYFFLLDISGSISSSDFKAVREGLLAWYDAMGLEDKMVLITFGAEVRVLLNGSEARNVAIETIASLKNNDDSTHFFDAVSAATDLSRTLEGLPERQVAIAITDGKDVSEGGSATQSEIARKLSETGMSLYALGLGRNKTQLDALGELSRASGGNLFAFERTRGSEQMLDILGQLRSCYLLSLAAPTNIVDETAKLLSIRYSDGAQQYTASLMLPLSAWVPDTVAPKIIAVQSENEKTIRVVFSEDVTGADNPVNYSIYDNTTSGGTADNAPYAAVHILSALYNAQDFSSTLLLADPLYTGTYALSAANIQDRSMERNVLDGNGLPVSFHAEGIPKPTAAPVDAEVEEGSSVSALWFFLPAAALAFALILFLLSRRKTKESAGQTAIQEAGSEQLRIQSAMMPRIKIHVIEPNGITRVVSVSILQSYTVGRSASMCDMAVDDPQLSRRHFRFVLQDDVLLIEDLQSLNKTYVNHIPISTPRAVSPDDLIEAGNTRFRLELS